MKSRAGSIRAMHQPHRAGEGGSIPAPALHFQVGMTDEAAALVLRHHYSHRLPSAIQIVGTFHEPGGLWGDCGRALAACIFSVPPTRWAEGVLELSRLVRTDDSRPPLSRLIKLTCIYLKRDTAADLVVSFADWTQKHHGGIYQAASWHYGGQRERQMDGVIVGGRFYPGRSCNSLWGTRSPDKLTAILKTAVQPHYDDGKHLYWKALSASGRTKAERLNLESLPYPKPDQEKGFPKNTTICS